MTLTIELEPEVERQLEIEAARLGVSKAQRVEELVKAGLKKPAISLSQQEDIERRLKLMDEFVQAAHEYSKGAPPLSDYAVSRDAIYTEYEEERNR